MFQTPTKMEMTDMFTRLENSIKTEISTLQADLGQLLIHMEVTEEKKTTDKQAQGLIKLKEQVKHMQLDQRRMLYKLEEQENQNRRKNLRIRALLEERGEYLIKIMNKITKTLLDIVVKDSLKIERVHRIRKPQNI